MGVQTTDVFTKEITDDSITITPEMGVRLISVYNGSAVTGTVQGSRKLGGTSSGAINVVQYMTYTIEMIDASVINSFVITAPSGCTLKITAQ